MTEKLNEMVIRLPKQNLANLMWSALDAMQLYNGRSKEFCILTAMGAIAEEKGDGTFIWNVPSIEEIKKNTNTRI